MAAAASTPDLLSLHSFPSSKSPLAPSPSPSRLLRPTPPPSPTPRLAVRLPRRGAASLPPRALVYGAARTGALARNLSVPTDCLFASRVALIDLLLHALAGARDPELRAVLELATDNDLFELEDILFGTSLFSPVLKSIAEKPGLDYALYPEDAKGRDDFIERLESRFLFLAADARSTLRGWRPSYRDVLLSVRQKLGIHCSSHLCTADLEVEIFLHLLWEYACQQRDPDQLPWDLSFPTNHGNLEFGLSRWKIDAFAALKAGAKEAQQIFLKGGGILTLGKLYQLLARRLSGKMVMEAANCQIKHELLKKGGQFAAINLESRAALLTARMGFARAASNYLGLRSLMTLLGPVLWGTFLADLVIQMLGTDYARILRAIYVFAQIRLTWTRGWTATRN